MANPKEKIVDVTLDNGDKVTIKVIKPTNRLNSRAQRIGATVWTQCIQDGVMTKQELMQLMENKGIWGKAEQNKQDEIQADIAGLEKQLFINKKKKIKVSEAKGIAMKMKEKRIELRDHIAKRLELEGNTAEALSDNAKFDFLVANCTLWENGNKVYNNLDEYQDSGDDSLAFTAAATLAEMIYAIDSEFEKALPENAFLRAAGIINDEMQYVDKDGNRVDSKGKKINDLGWYLDDDGNRVDVDGNPLNENGTFVAQVSYIDDETGEEVSIEAEPEEEEETSQEPEENSDTES
ncbi:MAG: hypothetical protein CMH30_00065 [Micavibrio sp.]|jgi:hypothetical protein|nr:hypothetical protein [Micavibrio sp.]|tara:strand:- start:1828 stop:2706 length:879 start_codon:yes stop_codon:yes gene_type:complete